ncbi:MAG: hypothetical protein QOI77_3291, partial [Blastocatellia bacterium]|nr:hypothetical protein [Blastocatellia bacterium]
VRQRARPAQAGAGISFKGCALRAGGQDVRAPERGQSVATYPLFFNAISGK